MKNGIKEKKEKAVKEIEEYQKTWGEDGWVLPVLLLLIFGLKGEDMIADALKEKDKIIENNKIKEN